MFKKINKFYLLFVTCLILSIITSCSKDSNDEPYEPPTNYTGLVPPSNVSARIVNSGIEISWTPVSDYYVDGYIITRQSGGYESILGYIGDSGVVNSNFAVDNSPRPGYNTYSVRTIHRTSSSSYTQSKPSNEVTIYYDSNSSGGGNTGGGNTGGDNTGGGNTGGGNTGGGTIQKPSAPTGVYVTNEGNNYIPDVRVRWNSVSNATSYYIYKSTSANGSYYKIGETTYAQYGYSDSNAPTNGASAYYKIKAVNSAGESAFSDYAKYTSTTNDDAFSPAYTYGNCSVSGNTMTLRWTNSTGHGYGKATEVILRVWNPYAEEWQDTKLSASATSTSFNYSTKIDGDGFVKAGIVVSNDAGSFTAGAKVYDTKSRRWLN